MSNALLVLAHPKDEVIAIGGRMGRFANSHFVHVTPPHEPPVLNDGYPWGMNSIRFSNSPARRNKNCATAIAT